MWLDLSRSPNNYELHPPLSGPSHMWFSPRHLPCFRSEGVVGLYLQYRYPKILLIFYCIPQQIQWNPSFPWYCWGKNPNKTTIFHGEIPVHALLTPGWCGLWLLLLPRIQQKSCGWAEIETARTLKSEDFGRLGTWNQFESLPCLSCSSLKTIKRYQKYVSVAPWKPCLNR